MGTHVLIHVARQRASRKDITDMEFQDDISRACLRRQGGPGGAGMVVATRARRPAPTLVLLGVVAHVGRNVSRGHFFAFLRRGLGGSPWDWIHCDDAHLSNVHRHDVARGAHWGDSYLLVYVPAGLQPTYTLSVPLLH